MHLDNVRKEMRVLATHLFHYYTVLLQNCIFVCCKLLLLLLHPRPQYCKSEDSACKGVFGMRHIIWNIMSTVMAKYLLLILVITALLLLGSGSSALALDTARASTTVRRGESEVNMLLGVKTNDE